MTLLIVGQKLAGIGGAIGGIFIAFGLNKVISNPNYSKNKKVLYSALYSMGGITIAAAIVIALTTVLSYYFPAIGQKDNIETTYQIPNNFSSYKNAKMGISALAYPADWTVKQDDKDEYTVIFQSPDKTSNVTLIVSALADGQKIDYKTYIAELAEQAKSEPNISFQNTGEEIRNINGKDWLIYNSTISIKSAKSIYYNRTGVLTTGTKKDQPYFQILMESDKDHFAEDSKILDSMIESLRLYQ